MAKWFYYNESGEKIEITGGQLKGLAKAGMITPDTIVETEDGKKARAGKVQGLTFLASALNTEPKSTIPSSGSGEVYGMSVPPPIPSPSTAAMPETVDMPVADMPIVEDSVIFPPITAQTVPIPQVVPSPEPSHGTGSPSEPSKSFEHSFGTGIRGHDVGFRIFLSPILIVFIWWLTVICCVIGYFVFIGNELQPYFSAARAYRADMSEYRTKMQKFRTDTKEYDRAILTNKQDYDRAMQKYQTDMKEYDRVIQNNRQEYDRAMQKYQTDKQEYDRAMQKYRTESLGKTATVQLGQGQAKPEESKKPDEPKRPEEPKKPEEPQKPVEPRKPVDPPKPIEPTRPMKSSEASLPVLSIFLATISVIYSLIVVRIFLEFIAVNFRMEKHQRTMRTTLEKYEKMSKQE